MSDYRATGVNDYVGVVMDFETGGLNPNKNAITQISISSFRIKDLKMMDKYVSFVKPYRKKVTSKKKLKNKFEEIDNSEPHIDECLEYEEKALEYTNISIEDCIDKGLDIREVADKCVTLIENSRISKSKKHKPFFLGQNIQFDIGFWQQMMDYAGMDIQKRYEKAMSGIKDYYGNFQPHYVDTLDLARMKFGDNDNIDKYKLENIAARLGAPIYDAHDAQADTDATFNVFAILSQQLRSGGISDVDGVIEKDKKARRIFNI